LNDDEDVNRTWENIKENIQTSAKESLGLHELKQNKPWFDEECLGFLDQRKRTKMQWIRDPSQSNVDILNSVRREVSRHFRNKKKAYLRAKIEKLETNSKNQNIRDLYRGNNDFKKGYQPRCEDEKGDVVADSHSIVARWRNYFSQLFNVHGVKDVGQAEIHTAEPLVHEPSASEVEQAIDKLKGHKSPGTDQIPTELIKAGVEQFAWRFINLLLLFGRRRNCLKSGRSRSLYLFIKRGIKQIVIIIEPYHFCQPLTQFYPTSCSQG